MAERTPSNTAGNVDVYGFVCHNGSFKLTVKVLDHAIRLGVVARCAIFDYTKLVTQIIP